MKFTDVSGDSLADDFGVFVNEDAHIIVSVVLFLICCLVIFAVY